jgi:hypothetical protein
MEAALTASGFSLRRRHVQGKSILLRKVNGNLGCLKGFGGASFFRCAPRGFVK